MPLTFRFVLSAAIVAATTSIASAQSGTVPPAVPPATPGSPQTIPEKTPSSPAKPDANGTLTEKLDKSDGVIKPPTGIDPGMTKPAPPTAGTMPVIKPPGETGGPAAK